MLNILIAALTLNTSFAFSKTLTMRLDSAPVILDWTTQSTLTESPVIMNTQEGLFKAQLPSEKLIPALASSVKKSKDSKEYTFTIRKDAKWSDGQPIYAQDFVYGWLRAISPQSTSIYTYYFFDVVNAREYNQKKINSTDDVGIKAMNDTTLVVKLKHAVPNWEVRTAFWPFFPARKDLVEKFGGNWWRPGVAVSSGPFVIDTYESGTKMILKRNPHYPKNKSNVDQIELKFSSNFDQALKDYDSNKIDVLGALPFQQLAQLTHRKDAQHVPLMRIYSFGFNTERFPVNNRKFRQALLMAIDRKKIIPAGESGLKFTQSLIAPPLDGSESAIPLVYDVDAAKALLKESAVVLNPKLKIQIITGNQEPTVTMAKAIQSQLMKNLGINVEVNAVDGEEYTTYMNIGEYSAFVTTWTAKIRTAADFLLPYSGVALNNRTRYFNSTFDSYLENGQYKKAQKLIAVDDAVIIPLCLERPYALVHPQIKNLFFDHMGVPHFEQVSIK